MVMIMRRARAIRGLGLELGVKLELNSPILINYAGRDELQSSYFCSDEVVSCRFLAGRTRELEISRLTNSGVPKRLRNS